MWGIKIPEYHSKIALGKKEKKNKSKNASLRIATKLKKKNNRAFMLVSIHAVSSK